MRFRPKLYAFLLAIVLFQPFILYAEPLPCRTTKTILADGTILYECYSKPAKKIEDQTADEELIILDGNAPKNPDLYGQKVSLINEIWRVNNFARPDLRTYEENARIEELIQELILFLKQDPDIFTMADLLTLVLFGTRYQDDIEKLFEMHSGNKRVWTSGQTLHLYSEYISAESALPEYRLNDEDVKQVLKKAANIIRDNVDHCVDEKLRYAFMHFDPTTYYSLKDKMSGCVNY